MPRTSRGSSRNRSVADATTHGVLRIIQSVPSPKAEPFKLRLAQVGAERIEETVDPEQGIDRAFELVLNMLADALSDVEALEAGMSSSTALSDASTQELLSRLRRSDIPSPLST